MKQIVFSLIFFLFILSTYSQRIANVSATYTYYAPETMSLEEAKRTALDRAKIQAIADEFGSDISQNTTTSIINSTNKSDVRFFMFGTSDIKGEWIETIGQPSFSVKYESSILSVTCKVEGKIREITQPELEIDAKLLKNGLTNNFESSDFIDGDSFYLQFTSSADGFITIYLLQNDVVYKLLPYKRSCENEFSVVADRNYTFFSKTSDINNSQSVDEYELYANNQIDVADILILYTPKTIGADPSKVYAYDEPLSMDIETFNKWLVRKRNKDKYSKVKILPLIIKKK